MTFSDISNNKCQTVFLRSCSLPLTKSSKISLCDAANGFILTSRPTVAFDNTLHFRTTHYSITVSPSLRMIRTNVRKDTHMQCTNECRQAYAISLWSCALLPSSASGHWLSTASSGTHNLQVPKVQAEN
jgi:hypothetical protein